MEEKNFLQNKKVLVKFVGRKGGLNNQKGHVLEGGKMVGTYTRFPAPTTGSGTIKDFLTKDEVEFFSQRLGENIASSNKEYWDNFGISLTKEDMILDLSDPLQMLQFKVLHEYRQKVCTNPAELTNRATYQWCIYNTDDEVTSKKTELDGQQKAYINFGRIQSNRDILAYLYRNIEGRIISRETSLVDAQTKFLEILTKKHAKFNLLLQDALLDEKVIINTAYELGIISEKSGEYSDVKTGKKLCESGKANEQTAAEYLASPVNQDLRLELEARIKVAKD